MTREFFNKQFTAMVVSYPNAQKLADEAQDVYWEMLQHMPQDAFHKAVKKCLGECKFFPTIAELGEAAFPAYTRLSDRWVQTKNGMDRLPIKVTWQTQLNELNWAQEQKEIEANPELHKLIKQIADDKGVK